MKKALNCAGVFVGILCIIFSICTFTMDTTNYTKYEKYGGDAYTGIQNAASDTANNVNDLRNSLAEFGGYVLLIAGLVITIHFAKELSEDSYHSYSTATTEKVEICTSWTCPSCGSENPTTKGFCQGCGLQKSVDILKTGEEFTYAGKWTCPSCGSENPVSKGFCQNCGYQKK